MEYFISDLHLFHENCLKFDQRPFKNIQEMHDTIVKNWNEKVNNSDTIYILGDISMRKGSNIELIELVSSLKGHKVLIKGNHDQIKDYRYQQLFQEIADYKEIQTTLPVEMIMYEGNSVLDAIHKSLPENCGTFPIRGKIINALKCTEESNPIKRGSVNVVLSHYPILMWRNQHRGAVHLYGHLHNSAEETIVQDTLERINRGDFVNDWPPRRRGNEPLKAYNVGCMMPWMAYTPRTLEEIISGYNKLKAKTYRR